MTVNKILNLAGAAMGVIALLISLGTMWVEIFERTGNITVVTLLLFLTGASAVATYKCWRDYASHDTAGGQ